jgi:hypothetical protein
MSGSVFLVGLVVVIMLVFAVVLSPIFLVPAVLLVLAAVLFPVLMGAFRNSAISESGGGPSGVPSTREASYEPTQEPTERGAGT